jgi:hypothetical protein
VLALLFGACSYLALLKIQSSHYFFAGAPFLMLFALSVYDRALGPGPVQRKMLVRISVAGVALLVVVSVSILTYRPDALQRLTQLRAFDAEERPVREFVQRRVRPDQYVLFAGGGVPPTWAYWVSHRYPPPPFINADVRTIWALRNRPESVFNLLDNPRLALVQFDPDQVAEPRMDDPFGDSPVDALRMQEYLSRLQVAFVSFDGPMRGSGQAKYWSRQR